MRTTGVPRPRRALGAEDLAAVARAVAAPMAVGLVVATAMSVTAGLLIEGPLAGSVGGWDQRVVEASVDRRTPAFDRFTGLVDLLADTLPVAVLWIGAMAVGARATGRWVVPMFLLFVIGGEKLTYLVTSLIVDRPRPTVEALGHVYATGSFPSGTWGRR